MPMHVTEAPGHCDDEVVFTVTVTHREAAAVRRILTGLESLTYVDAPLPQRKEEPWVRLKKFRQLRNLKQKELADAVGTTQSHISKYEAGLRKIPTDVAERLGLLFQCDPAEFLS